MFTDTAKPEQEAWPYQPCSEVQRATILCEGFVRDTLTGLVRRDPEAVCEKAARRHGVDDLLELAGFTTSYVIISIEKVGGHSAEIWIKDISDQHDAIEWLQHVFVMILLAQNKPRAVQHAAEQIFRSIVHRRAQHKMPALDS